MKRPGIRLLYVLVLLGIFSTFLVPEKTFASIDPSYAQSVSDLVQSTLKNVDIGGASQSWADGIISDEVTVAQNTYNAEKDTPNISLLQYKLDVLNAVLTDLNKKNQVKTTFGADFNALAQKYISVISPMMGALSTTIDKNNGVITAQQKVALDATSLANAQKLNAAASKAVASTPASAPGDKIRCSLTGSFSDCISDLFTWFIKTMFLNIAGFLLWVSANMLNYAIQIGVLTFSKWAPDTLYPIWIVVRQIVSLFVVFAGLYLGFMYIIGREERFQKYLPWVIMFALFVNFSYPLARTAIDVSNIVSLNIYASAVGGDTLNATLSSPNTAGALIMKSLGLQGLVFSATDNASNSNVNVAGAGNSPSLTAVSTPAGAIMVVFFVLYAAYIFFMLTALIVTRTIVLVFLIIASPILLVDSVIPQLGDQAEKLRKIFFEQLAVGPVFMIMLALTLKFLQVFSLASPNVPNNAIVEFFNVTLMLIMLHITYKVTKHFAGEIGQMATNAMGKVGGYAVGGAAGMAFAGSGLLARQTIGQKAAEWSNSEWLNTQAGKSGVAGFLGRRAYNMTDSVAKSSFDARNLSYVQTGASRLGLSGGMGTGGKAGFEALEEARKKNMERHLGRVGTHKENVYDASGKLKAKKGDLKIDDASVSARQDFIKNSKGSLFSGKQGDADVQFNLSEANKKQVKDQKAQEVSSLSELDKDRPEDKSKIDALFEKYRLDLEMTKKLKDAFKKKIMDDFVNLGDDTTKKEQFINRLALAPALSVEKGMENTLLNLDAKTALTEYKALPSSAAKTRYKDAQTSETKTALEEHDTKIERKEAEDTAIKTAMRDEQERTTAAVERLAAVFTP